MISGKGMYIWNASRTENGNPSAIAQLAKEAGLTHVLLKIADGPWVFNVANGHDLAKPIIDALKHVGVQVLGWQYVYGRNPEAEADIAIQRCKQLNVDGFVVNAESEYKNKPAQATIYMKRLRKGLETTLIGLSSYRFPRLHQTFPFANFLEYCDVNMPQVYWMQATNSGAQLRACIAEYRSLPIPQRPIIPTGAAFQEHGWRTQPNEVKEFLDVARELCQACNFWVWEHARRYPELWDVIAGYEWSAGMDQQIELPNKPRLRVKQVTNIRSGPEVVFPVIGKLQPGEEVSVVDINDIHIENPRRVWIKHARGWSAIVYDGSSLMEKAA